MGNKLEMIKLQANGSLSKKKILCYMGINDIPTGKLMLVENSFWNLSIFFYCLELQMYLSWAKIMKCKSQNSLKMTIFFVDFFLLFSEKIKFKTKNMGK